MFKRSDYVTINDPELVKEVYEITTIETNWDDKYAYFTTGGFCNVNNLKMHTKSKPPTLSDKTLLLFKRKNKLNTRNFKNYRYGRLWKIVKDLESIGYVFFKKKIHRGTAGKKIAEYTLVS